VVWRKTEFLLLVVLGAGCSSNSTADIDAPLAEATLTVVSAWGQVTSLPTGIDCGATCSHTFPQLTQVTLNAVSQEGYTFSSWRGGGCDGHSGSCQVTLSSDTTVTAEYTQICDTSAPLFDSGGTNGWARVPVTNQMPDGPTDLAFVPGTSDFIVATRNGTLHYFSSSCDPQTTIDLTGAGVPITSGGEQGLLNITFHPDWAKNQLVFIYHTSSSDPINSISRLELTVNAGEMTVANPVRVIDFIKRTGAANHNGGGLVFAPDKTLLASVGEGGSNISAQRTNNLLGAVVRITPALTGDTAYDYAIPPGNMFSATNPRCFATAESSSDCPELLAIGLRNPYTMTIDGNVVYLGDVGTTFEEINSFDFRDNTVNFGWATHDGPANTAPFTDPILSYRRDEEPTITFRNDDPACSGQQCTVDTASIMIGDVYRGARYEGLLQGTLVWADFYQGFVRGLGVTDAGAPTGASSHLVHRTATDVMVSGPDGYYYMASLFNRRVYRLERP